MSGFNTKSIFIKGLHILSDYFLWKDIKLPCDKQTHHLFRCRKQCIHYLLTDPQNSSRLHVLYMCATVKDNNKNVKGF